MNKKTLVVNLFAGPGSGKSTSMAHIFAMLKWKGFDCEMASEYAKDKVWENSHDVLNDQFYVSAKQYHKLFRLNGKVEIIITDSPILLGAYYGRKEPKEFQDLLLRKHCDFNNLNFFLERIKKFNPNGRLQTEDQAKEIDTFVREKLNSISEKYFSMAATKENIPDLVEIIEEEYKK